jgi:hypothetical protein
MKKKLRKVLLASFLVTTFLFSQVVFADPPGPPGPGGDPSGGGIPVGGPVGDGISILIFLAVAYGSYLLYKAWRAKKAGELMSW